MDTFRRLYFSVQLFGRRRRIQTLPILFFYYLVFLAHFLVEQTNFLHTYFLKSNLTLSAFKNVELWKVQSNIFKQLQMASWREREAERRTERLSNCLDI